jgi:hypothetical protein
VSRPVDSLDPAWWPRRRSSSSELEEGPGHRPNSRFLCPSGSVSPENVEKTGDSRAESHAEIPPRTARMRMQWGQPRCVVTGPNPSFCALQDRTNALVTAMFDGLCALQPILGFHHAASSYPWTKPGQERCSAESSERSSLATTPEPRRDRLGSLPTPHPRFPPPSSSTIGDLLAAGQTHDAELSLCLTVGRKISRVGVAPM